MITFFLHFPLLGTPGTYCEDGGRVGERILKLRIFAGEILVSNWLIFVDGTKI